MSTNRGVVALAVGSAIFAFAGGTLPAPASAAELVAEAPRVVVVVSDVVSQAHLQRQLELQGYTNIKLSPIMPNPSNPHPELNTTMVADPAHTPVHEGWNGTAMKGERTLNVRVEFGDTPAIAELPAD